MHSRLNFLEVLAGAGLNFIRIHQFTDGCAAQYKGSKAFSDVSFNSIPITQNYFETSHGKSVCDGLGAVIKNDCHRVVLSGKVVINDAKALFKFCETTMQYDIKDVVAYRDGEKITSRSIRQFIYIERLTVERNRPCSDVKTLKGTRQLHAIRGTGKPFHLHKKHLSCYCPVCASSDLTEVNCPNSA